MTMEKDELKKELDILTSKIKDNSKDEHSAQTLIDELLSIKGQMCVEPTELDCGKKEDEYKGTTFRITKTNRGILYHEFGGYSIFVTPTNAALYESLLAMMHNGNNEEEEPDSQSILTVSAITWVLQIPKIALQDAELTFEMATRIVEYINKVYDEATHKELQDETPEENEMFRSASIAQELLKD